MLEAFVIFRGSQTHAAVRKKRPCEEPGTPSNSGWQKPAPRGPGVPQEGPGTEFRSILDAPKIKIA